MKLLASLVLGQLLGALVHASLDEAGPRQHVAALLLRRQSSSEAPRALTAEAEISPRGSLAKRENPSFRRLLHLLKTGALGYFVAGQGPGGHLAKVHDFLARRGSELQPATQRRLERKQPPRPTRHQRRLDDGRNPDRGTGSARRALRPTSSRKMILG